MWTPVDLVRWTTGYLGDKGFHNARLNAELLLAGTLGCKRLDLYLQFDRPLTPDELAEFKRRLQRRARREPLQYIEGFAEFRALRLKVDGRVLIPRPETEQLVGEVLNWSRGRSGLAALDVGTGSGAIALSLAGEGRASFARVLATDASAAALEVAAENARFVGLEVEFRLGMGFEPAAGERFDVVVSNPPYIADGDEPTLDPEVRDWEPALALFGGSDGLRTLRVLVAQAPAHLRPGGLLALEIGSEQADAVSDLIRATGAFAAPRVVTDLAGRSRMVLATLEGGE